MTLWKTVSLTVIVGGALGYIVVGVKVARQRDKRVQEAEMDKLIEKTYSKNPSTSAG